MILRQLDNFIAFHLEGIIDACNTGNYNVAMMHLMQLGEILRYAAKYNASLN